MRSSIGLLSARDLGLEVTIAADSAVAPMALQRPADGVGDHGE